MSFSIYACVQKEFYENVDSFLNLGHSEKKLETTCLFTSLVQKGQPFALATAYASCWSALWRHNQRQGNNPPLVKVLTH